MGVHCRGCWGCGLRGEIGFSGAKSSCGSEMSAALYFLWSC